MGYCGTYASFNLDIQGPVHVCPLLCLTVCLVFQALLPDSPPPCANLLHDL